MPVAAALLTAIALAAAGAPAASGAAAPPVTVSATPIKRALSTAPSASTVTVKNVSRKRLTGLSLTVKTAKGLRVTVKGARKGRRSRAIPTLRPGKSTRVRVTLRRTSSGPRKGALGVRVLRKGKAVGRATVAFGPGATGAPANPNSLAGRYFWGSTYSLSGIQQHTLYFTSDGFVFVDDTGSALPTCAAAGEQCKPYAYDAAKKQLTIDGKPATLDGLKLTYDGDSYAEFGFPAAGARWDTRVTYSNSSGICPLYCSYYTENLTFLPDGTFVRDAVSSGTGPVVDWASVPPDSKGTYEVRADHTLRLAFADGKERVETVALYKNADGSLQAAGEGLLLGGDGYFDIRD